MRSCAGEWDGPPGNVSSRAIPSRPGQRPSWPRLRWRKNPASARARRLAARLRGPFQTRFPFVQDGWASSTAPRSAVVLTATATTMTRPVQTIPEYAHEVYGREGTDSPGGATDVPAPGMAVGADWSRRLVASRALACDVARSRGSSPGRVARRGSAHNGQVRAAPGRIPSRSSRGCDLRQALPRARLPRNVAPVVSQGQGSQRGQAVRGPRGDRRTDHPSHRPG